MMTNVNKAAQRFSVLIKAASMGIALNQTSLEIAADVMAHYTGTTHEQAMQALLDAGITTNTLQPTELDVVTVARAASI